MHLQAELDDTTPNEVNGLADAEIHARIARGEVNQAAMPTSRQARGTMLTTQLVAGESHVASSHDPDQLRYAPVNAAAVRGYRLSIPASLHWSDCARIMHKCLGANGRLILRA